MTDRAYEKAQGVCARAGEDMVLSPGLTESYIVPLIATALREAVAAETDRTAVIAWEYARGIRKPSGTSAQQGDDIAAAIKAIKE